MSHPAYNTIEAARTDLENRCTESGIPIHRLEFVAVFDSWSDSHTLWIFYATNDDLIKFSKDGTSEKVKTYYLGFLKLHDFPFSQFPHVIVEFDSDENVQKNHGGSYFLRLR